MEELLRQVLGDLAANPVRSAVEVIQSLLLLVIVAWATSKFARRQLAERHSRIATELAAAEAAERDGTGLEAKARDLATGIEQQVAEVLRAAREQAEQERKTSMAQVTVDGEQAVVQARQSVEREKERVVREASERLVRLTAEAARRYLDEVLTENQRRTLIQRAILESLEELSGAAASREAGVS